MYGGPAASEVRRPARQRRLAEGVEMRSILALVYVVVGFFVAGAQGYLVFDTLPHALSAFAGILLWPLLFFGVDLRIGP